MKLGILKSLTKEYERYICACKELNIEYIVIDIISSNWIENIKNNLDCSGFLARPSHAFQAHNDVYMERLYFINKILNKPIYPSYEELYLYENKRNMTSWLELNNFPVVNTKVFVDKSEAKKFVNSTNYPIVVKSNIGASASGVEIVKSKKGAKKIVENIFGRFHPKLALGHFKKQKKYGINIPLYGKSEKHVMIIQEFKEIKWEWRIIKIDNSYFGHQKLLNGEFASGSDAVGWIKPPKELLDMVRSICDKGQFYSMAVDIFETVDNKYYVNELQSLFGSYLDSQMKIDGINGRYAYINDKYIFEEGEFNTCGSYSLRVKHFIKLLSS